MQNLKAIDSHAHLNFAAFEKDRDLVIEDSHKQGVGMINVGAGFDTSRKAVEVAQGYSQGVWAAVGVHPIHALDEDWSEEAMRDLISNNERVVAVGETGLDYFHLFSDRGKVKNAAGNVAKNAVGKAAQNAATKDSKKTHENWGKSPEEIKEIQAKLFIKHLELARLVNLPVIFHCRHFENLDAHFDLLKILEEFASRYKDFQLRGVMHCYTGDEKMAEIYLKLGLYIGFTGVVTFSKDYDKVIEAVPLEQLLIETDCPYLSPVPKRGERNVPANVLLVAEKVAEVKGVEVVEVLRQTTENAIELFNLQF